MAERTLLKNFLSCHVCSETFKDPVSLNCNHNFCSSCLQKFWEQAGNKNCPICKRKSSKEDLDVNFTLKELADSFAKRQCQSSAVTDKEKEIKKEEEVCVKHSEVSYLFCNDEQKAVCPVCEFSLHQTHKGVPLKQAVSDLKEQLESDLTCLEEKRDKYKKVEITYNKIIQHSRNQLLFTENKIRAEFTKLHQFLKDEEESRLAALKKEGEQNEEIINRKMKRTKKQINSLSDSISAVEQELKKDNVPFLSSYKPIQIKARAQCSHSDPQLVSGVLIDVAKHLGNLAFRVWKKMGEKVHFSPVILDPNTANPILYLSDDLISVRRGDTNQDLPYNPERFTEYNEVLGSEGFSSGKHSWEVEVGDHPDWIIGLVKETVDKNEPVSSPENGFWCLEHGDGKYTDGDDKTVTVKKSLQRIRVQLDYESGQVSFYNSEDQTEIYTHRDTFTEKLFPYFYVKKAVDAKTTDIKICQREINVN
ncbi:nuclear factor 7, brain-like [Mugil cephalus]|uniref:nuclear factor 7, brain-like n=1 Tax=Mugil cephalus TaxID=48193 RepID=UPI001FB594D7|nr:nuclear factor 7, brain-like [Mugil cephalus]